MASIDDFYNKYHVNLIALFGVSVLVYIGIFSLFNHISLNTPEYKPWILMIEIVLWVLFIVILFLNMKYFKDFEFDFNSVLYNLFGTQNPQLEVRVNKQVDISACTVDASNTDTGEVFHIPHNKYTYKHAKETCEMLDARLATYDEVEDSYKNGANWCSYGWSSDQLALFPIQKSMYNELKKIPGHQHDCGRVGVNGGYMEDPHLKFGVNCYGKKPYASENDLEYMHSFSYSAGSPQAEVEKKKQQDKIDNLLIAPFNKDKWSEN